MIKILIMTFCRGRGSCAGRKKKKEEGTWKPVKGLEGYIFF